MQIYCEQCIMFKFPFLPLKASSQATRITMIPERFVVIISIFYSNSCLDCHYWGGHFLSSAPSFSFSISFFAYLQASAGIWHVRCIKSIKRRNDDWKKTRKERNEWDVKRKRWDWIRRTEWTNQSKDIWWEHGDKSKGERLIVRISKYGHSKGR